jgi:hypothetical protein
MTRSVVLPSSQRATRPRPRVAITIMVQPCRRAVSTICRSAEPDRTTPRTRRSRERSAVILLWTAR